MMAYHEPPIQRHSVQAAKALSGGTAFAGIYLLRKRTVKTARNGSPFLMVEFGDKTGNCGTTIFSDSPMFEVFSSLEEGSILEVHATVDNYQGRFAPRINSAVVILPEALDADMLDQLVESSPENINAMWEELCTCIAAIPHDGVRELVHSVMDEVGEVFRTSSAAVSMHHAYRGGLLEHTLHVTRAAKVLLPFYPQVDPSLALAGAILHDVGKTLEYTQGFVTKRTRIGIMQGHVVLGYQIVRKHGLRKRIAPGILERLEHVILSHQGELEWGAAAMASTPEAIFISMVDNLDAKMGMVQRALRNAAPSEEFSEYLPGLKASVLLLQPFAESL